MRMPFLPRAFRAPSRLHLTLVAAVILAVVGACNVAADRSTLTMDTAASGYAAPGFTGGADEGRGVGLEMAQSRAVKTTPAARPAPPLSSAPLAQQPDPTGMVIRNGHVVVRVDSLEQAIERVRRLATAMGGSVGNVTVNTGEREVRSATLEMKVPSARFDEAMTGMSPVGRVEHSTASAQDVGEEFVDITARLANARRLEARLLDLLANRTGRLEDVLAVERELARVREEIERYEGRLRYLSTRVATSTIVAALHEKAPIVAAPGTNVIGNAFLTMWRNFVRFVAGLIEALGVLIPVAALAAGGFFAWKRWNRSRAVDAPTGVVAK